MGGPIQTLRSGRLAGHTGVGRLWTPPEHPDNRIERQPNGNPTTYKGVGLTFDYENRLTRCGNTTQIYSAYNALGLRVKKTVGSTVTWYLYDGAVPVLELNNDGTIKALTTFGPNGLISRRVGSATSFYTFDPLGNAANVINASGSVLYNCGYDAYGQPYGNATMLT
jgi:hypothetical protein